MSLIKAVHHISMTAVSDEEYTKTKKFYSDILGLDIKREWDGGIMFDTGSGIIEVMRKNADKLSTGTIEHYAFEVEDVDACAKKVAEAGYEVFIAPKDIKVASSPEFRARIAFCHGPLGEEIEFLEEK